MAAKKKKTGSLNSTITVGYSAVVWLHILDKRSDHLFLSFPLPLTILHRKSTYYSFFIWQYLLLTCRHKEFVAKNQYEKVNIKEKHNKLTYWPQRVREPEASTIFLLPQLHHWLNNPCTLQLPSISPSYDILQNFQTNIHIILLILWYSDILRCLSYSLLSKINLSKIRTYCCRPRENSSPLQYY